MPFVPALTGEEATRVNLNFRADENTLENVENQGTLASVVREVQTTQDFIGPYVSHRDLGRDLVLWENFTYKREPRVLRENIPAFQPVPQKVDKFGMTAQKYGDEYLLTDLVKTKSSVSFSRITFTEMVAGFKRLETRTAFAAMFNPVRWQFSPKWQTFNTTTGIFELDNSRIVAVVTKDANNKNKVGGDIGGGNYLAFADKITYVRLWRKFLDMNVMANVQICAAVTPNLQQQMIQTPEYTNREDLYHAMENYERDGYFYWRNIKWIRCTPEVMPGAFYAGQKFKAPSAAGPDIQLVEKDPNGTLTLTASNHEVIPFWIGTNIFSVTSTLMDRMKMIRVPMLRDEEMIFMERWLGGGRAQNVLQLNVCIPLVS